MIISIRNTLFSEPEDVQDGHFMILESISMGAWGNNLHGTTLFGHDVVMEAVCLEDKGRGLLSKDVAG